MLVFRNLSLVFSLLVAITLLSACSDDFTPKPKGYPRVVLPEKAYQNYEPSDCPFSFDHPTYSKIIKDTSFFKKAPTDPCWMDLIFPDMNAQVHFSYKEIENTEKGGLEALVRDAYKLNMKHVRVADYIEDSIFITPNGVYGIYYKVGGDAASGTQFLVTDSTKHFIWASLYFKERPNEDSIAPIANFINKDIDHLINSFEWK